MSLPDLMNQFFGSSNTANKNTTGTSSGNVLSDISSKIPSGLAGGALAGGVMALLMGNKSARKVAGKTATYGGAALLGGLAYKAYKNWQQTDAPANNVHHQAQQPQPSQIQQQQDAQFEQQALQHANSGQIDNHHQLTLIKAMVAAARSDGHIDEVEHKRIFDAVNQMTLDSATKGSVLDLFSKQIEVSEIAQALNTLEERSEVYLASCLVIDLDDTAEYSHLAKLSQALNLPAGLEQQLRAQAQQALSASA